MSWSCQGTPRVVIIPSQLIPRWEQETLVNSVRFPRKYYPSIMDTARSFAPVTPRTRGQVETYREISKLPKNAGLGSGVGVLRRTIGCVHEALQDCPRGLFAVPISTMFALLFTLTNLVAVADEVDDARIRDRIASGAAAASGIIIDGDGSDWSDIQTVEDAFEGPSDFSRDIVAVAVAPTETDLLVRLDARSAPTEVAGSFWIDVDFHGYRAIDFRLGLSSGQGQTVRIADPLGTVSQDAQTIGGVEVAVGDVVEARVPWGVIGQLLGPQTRAAIAQRFPRNWLRVYSFSYDPDTGEWVDFGPAVGSYVLRRESNSLDVPPPKPELNSVRLTVPVDGKWMVSQGAFSPVTHSGGWAYDLGVTDITGSWSEVRGSDRNSDYYSWGAEVFAPTSGSVAWVQDGREDLPPNNSFGTGADANRIGIALHDQIILHLTHFGKNSIESEVGDVLQEGDYLGRLGNSGNRSSAHLHFDVARGSSSTTGVPVVFTNVMVRLNPINSDVWTRHLANWPIREGFYVEVDE